MQANIKFNKEEVELDGFGYWKNGTDLDAIHPVNLINDSDPLDEDIGYCDIVFKDGTELLGVHKTLFQIVR